MAVNPQRATIIVVGIDYSDSCTRALNEAFALAAQKPGAEPHVIHVAALHGAVPDTFANINVEEAAKQLQTYVQAQLGQYVEKHPGASGFERVCTHQRVGNPADEIAQLARDLDADLVMVGTHSRRGIERLLLGSVAERVVRTAPCPVLVVRPKASSEVPKIEPACPQCVATRSSTSGHELWCEDHRRHHPSRHTYHYVHRNVAESNLPLIEPLTRR